MRFVIDTFIVWYDSPIALARDLIRRPPSRILAVYQDRYGRFVVEGF